METDSKQKDSKTQDDETFATDMLNDMYNS